MISGSGISASAGMSTYVNGGGLYQKAAKKYGLAKGIKLFDYSFYARRPRGDASRRRRGWDAEIPWRRRLGRG